ncbi:hypothetical protein A2U01_0040122, partial [Trifolium medium]|nr:hypothetical protein [Trifolium medium]
VAQIDGMNVGFHPWISGLAVGDNQYYEVHLDGYNLEWNITTCSIED